MVDLSHLSLGVLWFFPSQTSPDFFEALLWRAAETRGAGPGRLRLPGGLGQGRNAVGRAGLVGLKGTDLWWSGRPSSAGLMGLVEMHFFWRWPTGRSGSWRWSEWPNWWSWWLMKLGEVAKVDGQVVERRWSWVKWMVEHKSWWISRSWKVDQDECAEEVNPYPTARQLRLMVMLPVSLPSFAAGHRLDSVKPPFFPLARGGQLGEPPMWSPAFCPLQMTEITSSLRARSAAVRTWTALVTLWEKVGSAAWTSWPQLLPLMWVSPN